MIIKLFSPKQSQTTTQSEMSTFAFTYLFQITVSSSSSSLHAIRASASEYVPSQHTLRREFLKGVAALMPLPLVVLIEPPPSDAREVEVGSFLPPSPSDPSFVLFKASAKDTPALRAGTLI